MIISDNKKLIFIHIPKTAGSSIAKAIAKSTDDCQFGGRGREIDTHSTASQLKAYPYYDEYFSFAFVRNPWDRLYSWFAFLRDGKTVRPQLRHHVRSLGFKRWLMEDEHVLKGTFLPHEVPVGGQRRPQTDWLFDADMKPLVSFVGRFETLADDWNLIRKVVDVNPLPTEKFRKSERGDYREAYDDEMRDFVTQYFEQDIKQFGYKFDE